MRGVEGAMLVRDLGGVAVRDEGERRALAALVRSDVAVADGYLVALDESLLERAVKAAFEHSDQVALRTVLEQPDAQHVAVDVSPGDAEGIAEFLALAREAGVELARVVPMDTAGPAGGAVSAGSRGDPDEVSVMAHESEPWLVDRRSGRVSVHGSALTVMVAETVSDLADRAQLVLGYPVHLEWCAQETRIRLLTVRPHVVDPTKAPGSWSRLALVEADEGTVAPLAIDALDRGLGAGNESPSMGPAVRRVFARPYRKRRSAPAFGPHREASLGRAAAAAARATADVAPLLADAARFEREYPNVIARLDLVDLRGDTEAPLVAALRERHGFVADAFLLLDRARAQTRSVLGALEAVTGKLPRSIYGALAAPRAVGARRALNAELVALAKIVREASTPPASGKVTTMPSYDQLDVACRARWDDVRASTSGIRPLGIDVVPQPIGSSDADLERALIRLPNEGDAARERAREAAMHAAIEQAKGLRLALPRAALAHSLGALLDRVARAKGGISEGLAASLLRLRRAACEVGRRLEHEAILDAPEDALYLGLDELSQALSGEPGAYAARVRLRREDDQRWASFQAPRRLGR